jgi:hypothetical protein
MKPTRSINLLSTPRPEAAIPTAASDTASNRTGAGEVESRPPAWRLSFSAWLALFGLGLAV